MRNLLALLLASASLATATATPTVACGFSSPRVLWLTSHGSDGGGTRTFALLDTKAPDGLTWTQLWRMSYDNTATAKAPKLTAPMQVTLVGTQGTRELTTDNQIFVRESWGHDGATGALDLGKAEGFAIAVVGKHEHLAWTPFEPTGAIDEARERAWLAKQGVTAGTYISVERVRGNDDEVVFASTADGETITLLRAGDRVLAKLAGSATGILDADDMHYLVGTTRKATVVAPVWAI